MPKSGWTDSGGLTRLYCISFSRLIFTLLKVLHDFCVSRANQYCSSNVLMYSGGITLGGWDGCRKSNPPTDCGLSKFTSYQGLWSESAGHQAPPFSLVQHPYLAFSLPCPVLLDDTDNELSGILLSTIPSRVEHSKSNIVNNMLQLNLHMGSSLLSSHLYYKVTFFLSCHRNFHMNWTSFKRSTVLWGHLFFVPKVTSKYRFDCIYKCFD